MKNLKFIQILFAILILGIIAAGRMIKNSRIPTGTTSCEEKKKETSRKNIVDLTDMVRYHNKMLLK